jgi:hypothetical protein
MVANEMENMRDALAWPAARSESHLNSYDEAATMGAAHVTMPCAHDHPARTPGRDLIGGQQMHHTVSDTNR